MIDEKTSQNIHTTLLFPPSTSILFPKTTKGKLSGSEGLACRRFVKSITERITKLYSCHFSVKYKSIKAIPE